LRLATQVTRRPVAIALAATAFLVLCAASIFWLQLTPGSLSAIPRTARQPRG